MTNIKKWLASSCFVLFLCAATNAAIFTVSSTEDTSDANTADNICADVDNLCTLRAAIEQANQTTGADAINFDAGVFASLRIITLEAALPQIIEGLTITGTAPARLVVSGADGFQIFSVAAAAGTVGIGNLTVANASATTDGGGISNAGATLNLTNLVVRDNDTTARGGGIATSGGTVNITNSTVSGNTSTGGGGIFNLNGAVNLINSTITSNSSTNFGGGYFGFTDIGTATLTVRNTTIVSNMALSGGGIAVSAALGISGANLNNTIVANNTAGSSGPDLFGSVALGVGGTITSTGYNLIEDASGTTFTPAVGDQTGVDPLVAALADNGGLTPTIALLPGSSAIDKGNSALSGQTTDQRGFARPVDNPNVTNASGGNGADIGAFEVQPAAPTAATVTIGGRVLAANGRGIARARVSITDANGETRRATTNGFGYYRFGDVAVGETYVVEASAKRHRFAAQVLTVGEETNGLNFTDGK